MGDVIDFSGFRASRNGHPRDGIQIEVLPHAMIVRHYRAGILVGEDRILPERFLRDTLDEMDREAP
jgi:hypothetical protein